jgi:hypothetical protein
LAGVTVEADLPHRRSELPTADTGSPSFAGSFGLRVCRTIPLITTDADDTLPAACVLHAAHPNPFNPTTRIAITLNRTQIIRLTIHDLQGRLVRTLHDGLAEAGSSSWDFHAADLASGVYFYRLTGEEGVLTRKLLLVK